MPKAMLCSALLTVLAASAATAQAPFGWRECSVGRLPPPVQDSAASAEFRLDSAVYHGGRASAMVRVPADQGVANLCQSIQSDSYIGKRIRLSGWIRTRDVIYHSGLWMRVDGQAVPEMLSFDNMAQRTLSGTANWRKAEIVLDVPEGGSVVTFGLLIQGRGQAWLDDLSIEVVPKDVPSTNIAALVTAARAAPALEITEDEKQKILQSRRNAPKTPLNLDFERTGSRN